MMGASNLAIFIFSASLSISGICQAIAHNFMKNRSRDGLAAKDLITTTNQKQLHFLDCDWFKKLLFSTNSLAKLLLDSLLLDSSISQSHSKL